MNLEDLLRMLQALAPVLLVWPVFAAAFFWLEKMSQHSPHSYSTQDTPYRAQGNDCKCPVANCSICGEGR